MIKKIDQNVTTFYPDLKTYIEEKSRIDVKELTKIISDNVELSNNAKNATQEPHYVAVAPKADNATEDTVEVPTSDGLDTYF